jgi:hypothetical protein
MPVQECRPLEKYHKAANFPLLMGIQSRASRLDRHTEAEGNHTSV